MTRFLFLLAAVIATAWASTPLELQQQVSGLSEPGITYYTLGVPETGSEASHVLVIKVVVKGRIPLPDGSQVGLVASYAPNPTFESNPTYVQREGDEFTYSEGPAPEQWYSIQLSIRAPAPGTLFIGVQNTGTGENSSVPFIIKAIMAVESPLSFTSGWLSNTMPAGRDYAYFNVSRETLASVITPGVESYLFVQADVTEKMTLLIRSGKIPTLEFDGVQHYNVELLVPDITGDSDLHIAVIRDSLLAAAAFQIRIVELNPATPAPMQPPAGSPATEENQGLAAPAIFGITIACLIGGLLILAAVLAVIRRVKEGKRASANIENSTMFEPLNDQSYIEVNAN